jgi:hypothetical protein
MYPLTCFVSMLCGSGDDPHSMETTQVKGDIMSATDVYAWLQPLEIISWRRGCSSPSLAPCVCFGMCCSVCFDVCCCVVLTCVAVCVLTVLLCASDLCCCVCFDVCHCR